MTRQWTARDLAYDTIAVEWRAFIDDYDTQRRIEVLVADFLADRVAGRSVLDAGCGLGDFSKRLAELEPRRHVAVDISARLVGNLREILPNVDARVADLMDLRPVLGEERFDIVLSSEVIEHTPDPLLAVRNLCERVAPKGWLALSCPNALWKWLLHLAQAARIRKKYQGYENWVWGRALTAEIERCGLQIEHREGIHAVPWQLVPKGTLRAIDRRLRQHSYGRSINHAILARRV